MNPETSTAVIMQHQEPALPSLESTLRHVALVQQILNNVMKEGTHYGASFPGDKKKNLLKPGADALSLAFRLVPEFVIDERDLGGDHRSYNIVCRLLTQGSGTLIATGVGSASTKEAKYRYRTAKPACPLCGTVASVIKTKRGWWCVPDKGGCGGNPDAKDVESQQLGKVENPDPADVWNTCLKMGKKRAFVDATITACAASDLFTQDIEDLQDAIHQEEAKRPAKPAPAAAPAPAPVAEKPAAPAAAAAPAVKSEAEWKVESEKLFRTLKDTHAAWASIAWKAALATGTNAERAQNIAAAIKKIDALIGQLGDGGWEDIDHLASQAGEAPTKESAAAALKALLAYAPKVGGAQEGEPS